MAGFFGLFNYEKEGPGIRKDAPKKKTFIVFFEMLIRNFWKFIPISLLYVVLSVPVITNGLANAGITNVVRNTALDKHSFGISDFFETIKKNFKQSLILGILNSVIFVLLFFSARFYYSQLANTDSLFVSIGLGMVLCASMIFLFMQFYMWTMLITFDLKIRQILSNSFKFAFANIFKNLLCGILLILTYAVYTTIILLVPYLIVWVIMAFLIICTLPTYRFLMIQFVAFPAIKKYMIDPYYEQNPDLDIEQRKKLGLYSEPESEDPESLL